MCEGTPLWAMARWNRPWLNGEAIRAEVATLPEDCPNRVTLSGSPPNAAMFSRTQRRPARMSIRP